MKKIAVFIMILGSLFTVKAQEEASALSTPKMQEKFKTYYQKLVEKERHYNETSYELKIEFAKEQEQKKQKLLKKIKKLYEKLSLEDESGNKQNLQNISQLRESFIQEQKVAREQFKKKIFRKRQDFEDERLKQKAELEMALRQWKNNQQ